MSGGTSRRDFLRSATAISVGAFAGVGAYGFAYERHRLNRVVQDVTVRGLPAACSELSVSVASAVVGLAPCTTRTPVPSVVTPSLNVMVPAAGAL